MSRLYYLAWALFALTLFCQPSPQKPAILLCFQVSTLTLILGLLRFTFRKRCWPLLSVAFAALALLIDSPLNHRDDLQIFYSDGQPLRGIASRWGIWSPINLDNSLKINEKSVCLHQECSPIHHPFARIEEDLFTLQARERQNRSCLLKLKFDNQTFSQTIQSGDLIALTPKLHLRVQLISPDLPELPKAPNIAQLQPICPNCNGLITLAANATPQKISLENHELELFITQFEQKERAIFRRTRQSRWPVSACLLLFFGLFFDRYAHFRRREK